MIKIVSVTTFYFVYFLQILTSVIQIMVIVVRWLTVQTQMEVFHAFAAPVTIPRTMALRVKVRTI